MTVYETLKKLVYKKRELLDKIPTLEHGEERRKLVYGVTLLAELQIDILKDLKGGENG